MDSLSKKMGQSLQQLAFRLWCLLGTSKFRKSKWFNDLKPSRFHSIRHASRVDMGYIPPATFLARLSIHTRPRYKTY